MNKMMLAAATLALVFAGNISFAKSKLSKEETKAIKAECKQENPNGKKADIKKCVKEKSAAKAAETK